MASVATKIFQELVEGVFYIHNMGIVHRDLKVSGGDEIIERFLSGMTRCQFFELNGIVHLLRRTSLLSYKSLYIDPEHETFRLNLKTVIFGHLKILTVFR